MTVWRELLGGHRNTKLRGGGQQAHPGLHHLVHDERLLPVTNALKNGYKCMKCSTVRCDPRRRLHLSAQQAAPRSSASINVSKPFISPNCGIYL